MFSTGDQLAGYTLVARLGTGGGGELFFARQSGDVRPVAIELIDPRLSRNPELLRLLVSEAKLAARIDHPAVVRVGELELSGSTWFQVMEYLQSWPLALLQRILAQSGRRLWPSVAVAIVARAAEGLQAAHRTRDERGQLLGLVHGGVSPQHVLIGSFGQVKLAGFGRARAESLAETSLESAFNGRLRYMAPERARREPFDHRADIYALGVVLWEALTGQPLFRAENAAQLLERVKKPVIVAPSIHAPEVLPELDAVVLSALSPDPRGRPRTAEVLRQRLLEACPEARSIGEPTIARLAASVAGTTTPLPAEEARAMIETFTLGSSGTDDLRGPTSPGQLPAPLAAGTDSSRRLMWAFVAGTIIVAIALGLLLTMLPAPVPIEIPAETGSAL